MVQILHVVMITQLVTYWIQLPVHQIAINYIHRVTKEFLETEERKETKGTMEQLVHLDRW